MGAKKKAIVWHNPNCSKSRQALAFLEERGVEAEVRKYLKDPPTEKELRAAVEALGADSAHALVRKREKLYGELGVADMTSDELFAAMAQHPKLIERPVVLVGKKARIGRPTEAIADLL